MSHDEHRTPPSTIADGSVQLADLAPGARPRPPRALVPSHSDTLTSVSGTQVVFASRQVPSGRWLVIVSGTTLVDNGTVWCYLTVNGDIVNRSESFSPQEM